MTDHPPAHPLKALFTACRISAMSILAPLGFEEIGLLRIDSLSQPCVVEDSSPAVA